MKIVLATPLYPPDVEPVALYCKELARRLAMAGHEVIVATYGKYPEEVPGVTVVTTDKRQFLLVRIIKYTVALWKVVKNADMIYAQNGASVEFPVLIITNILKKPFVLFWTDVNAIKQAEKNFFLNVLAQAICRRTRMLIENFPPQKPEILPFEAPLGKVLTEYETVWDEHLEQLSLITP